MSTVSPSNYDNVNNIISGFYMLLPYLFNKNINTYVIRCIIDINISIIIGKVT